MTFTTIVFTSIILITATQAEMWIPLDFPGARETVVFDVDGDKTIGIYTDASWNTRGFVYDGTHWTTLHFPGSYSTNAFSSDGGTIVGSYSGSGYSSFHGFTYDGTNWTSLDYPGASTIIRAIDKGTIVGQYFNGSLLLSKGFVYDGQSWTTVHVPGSLQTIVTDIDNGTMVGHWKQNLSSDPSVIAPSKNNSFTFDGTNWTFLSCPGATETTAWGISGNRIVGSYSNTSNSLDHQGFIYDGTNWMTLNFPGAGYTEISGIDGDIL